MQIRDVLAVPDGLSDVEISAARPEIDAPRDGSDGTRIAGGDGDTAVQGECAAKSPAAPINRTTASSIHGGVRVTTAVVIENKARKDVASASKVEHPRAIDHDRVTRRDLPAIDVQGKSTAIDDHAIRRIRCQGNRDHPGSSAKAQRALTHNGATRVSIRGVNPQYGTTRLDEGNSPRSAPDGGGSIDDVRVDEDRGLVVINDQLGVAAGSVAPGGENTACCRGSDGGVVVVVAPDDAAHLKVEDIRGRTEGDIQSGTSV